MDKGHNPKQKLGAKDFTPHPDDVDGVNALSSLHARFRLTPRGRVWSVFVNYDFSDAHVDSLLQLPKLIEFNITRLFGQKSRFSDAGFRLMASHPTIQAFLDTYNPLLTDDSAAVVSESTQLRWVKFRGCSITDYGVQLISHATHILGLSLSCNPITDACLPDLCRLINLRRLWVLDTEMSFNSVAVLESALPRCRVNPK